MRPEFWLTVRGVQQYDGLDPDSIELSTEASLTSEDGVLFLSYEESELTGLAGTLTVSHRKQDAGGREQVGHDGERQQDGDSQAHEALHHVGAHHDSARFQAGQAPVVVAFLGNAQREGDEADGDAVVGEPLHEGRVDLHNAHELESEQHEARDDGGGHHGFADGGHHAAEPGRSEQGDRDVTELDDGGPEGGVRCRVVHGRSPICRRPCRSIYTLGH